MIDLSKSQCIFSRKARIGGKAKDSLAIRIEIEYKANNEDTVYIKI